MKKSLKNGLIAAGDSIRASVARPTVKKNPKLQSSEIWDSII